MSTDPRKILDDELAKWRAEKGNREPEPWPFKPVDLEALAGRQFTETEWLVEDIWPVGRQIHIHAQRKAGKSLLMLWIACHLAIGLDPFTREPRIPKVVGYYDPEMSEEDLRERLEDMGFLPIPPLLAQNLHYYLMQPLPPLDTEQGGLMLLQQCLAAKETVVLIDSLARFIQGKENDSNTYFDLYRFTGRPLKAAGIDMGRSDHEGWEEGRSRGSSAKNDDVDIVWHLKPTDDGMELTRKFARVSYVPETVSVLKRVEPNLHFTRSVMSWPAGTTDKAKELDELQIPLDAGRRSITKALKDAGRSVGATNVLTAAIRYRKQRALI
jgi:hypothetical protein